MIGDRVPRVQMAYLLVRASYLLVRASMACVGAGDAVRESGALRLSTC